jgi:hypothetical protein
MAGLSCLKLCSMFLLTDRPSHEFTMGTTDNGAFWVKARIGGAIGGAREISKPRAITFADARALGIEIAGKGLSATSAAMGHAPAIAQRTEKAGFMR